MLLMMRLLIIRNHKNGETDTPPPISSDPKPAGDTPEAPSETDAREEAPDTADEARSGRILRVVSLGIEMAIEITNHRPVCPKNRCVLSATHLDFFWKQQGL